MTTPAGGDLAALERDIAARVAAAPDDAALEAERVAALGKKGVVSELLKGLGTMSAQWRERRILRSPRDRRKMFIDGRWVVRFRPAEGVQRVLAARSPELWRDRRHQAAWRLAETLVSDLELYHREKIPRGFDGASAEDLESRLSAALGHHWRRVVQAFEQGVPPEVRMARNHLMEVARTRWSEPTESTGR